MAERKSSGGADFIARIVKDPANPPQTAMLTGYLGASSEKGHTRLYFDPSLSSYVEIPDDAILHSQDSGEAGGLGGSHVWVRRDAELIYGPAGAQRPKGKFLEGPIMQAHLAAGAAAAGAAQPITLPAPCGHPTLLPPCPTPHAPCVTQHCTIPPQCGPTPHAPCVTPVCTHLPACHPSVPPHCHVTLPLCPTETCHPSVQIACPSVHAICPTPSAVDACPSVRCVSQAAHLCPTPSAVDACPSVHCVSQGHICPTPSAVDACPSVHCVTQQPHCVATGVNCPSAVGCGPSLACNIPGQGVAVHPAAVAAAHGISPAVVCAQPLSVAHPCHTLFLCPSVWTICATPHTFNLLICQGVQVTPGLLGGPTPQFR
jgi:hypothetical protein